MRSCTVLGIFIWQQQDMGLDVLDDLMEGSGDVTGTLNRYKLVTMNSWFC